MKDRFSQFEFKLDSAIVGIKSLEEKISEMDERHREILARHDDLLRKYKTSSVLTACALLMVGATILLTQDTPGVTLRTKDGGGTLTDRVVITKDIAKSRIRFQKSNLQLEPAGIAAGDTADLRFFELAANGSNFTAFKAPDSLASDVTWTLPPDNTTGFMKNTAGTLSWVSIGSSGAVTTVNTISPTGAGNFTINGTSNQVVVTGGANSVTLSTPQDINTSSAPTFNGMTLTGAFAANGANTFGGAVTFNGSATFTGSIISTVKVTGVQNAMQVDPYGVAAGNTGELRLLELSANGTDYVGFKAPDALAASKIWVLPTADGSGGQALVTDGNGILSWTTTGGVPGGANKAVQFNNSGVFGGDASAFAWDNTNKRLGLGTSAPNYRLQVDSSAAASNKSVFVSCTGNTSVFGIDISTNSDLGAASALYGIRGAVGTTGAGDTAYGVYGAVGSVGTDNYGTYGNAGGGGSGNCIGAYGTATGLGVNYGIYGTASGGTTNWAGYFSGDTNITGNLYTGGTQRLSSAGALTSVTADTGILTSGTLAIARGGTNSNTALSGSSIMISNGSAIVQGSAGTTTTVLHGNAAGAPSYSAVSLANDITGTLGVANGGTGLTSGTSGGILGFTAAGTLASSGALTANAIVLGGGAGATPTVLGSLGTTTTVLHGNAAGAPSFGAVSLVSDITGTLGVGNGGTGSTSFTAGSVVFSNGSILAQDNASLFWDDTTNRLGIGTIAPDAELQVATSVTGGARGIISSQHSTDAFGPQIRTRKSRGTNAVPTIVANGDNMGSLKPEGFEGSAYITGGKIRFSVDGAPAAGSMPTRIEFYSGTSGDGLERMRIDNTGKIGIGTTAPGYPLEVVGQIRTSNPVGGLVFPDGTTMTTAAGTSTGLTSTTDLNLAADSDANGSGEMFFATNGTNRMKIANGGFVGIGTTSPSTEFHLATSSIAATRGILVSQHSADNNGAFISERKSRGTEAAPSAVASGDNIGSLAGYGYDGSGYTSGGRVRLAVDGAVAAGSVPTRLEFHTGTASNGAERMRIDSTGKVGIGTSSPAQTLDVTGGVNFTGDFVNQEMGWDQNNAWAGGSWTTVRTVTLTTHGTGVNNSAVLIVGFVNVDKSGAAALFSARLLRDGATVLMITTDTCLGSGRSTLPISFVDEPSAASHTYELQWDSPAAFTLDSTQLSVVEIKR